jgi:uncharacterized protein YdaU (DUF1376 family)
MPGSKPPFFPFYVKDFVADDLVQAMTTEQVGAYVLLLCAAWQGRPPGSIPNDDRVLARLARMEPIRWEESKAAVLEPFTMESDGRLHQKRLEAEYVKYIGISKKRSESGRRGGTNKHARDGPSSQANAKQMLSKCLANDEHSASGSQSESGSGFGFQGEVEGLETEGGILPTPPAALAQEFCGLYAGTSWKDRDVYAVTKATKELLRRGVAESEIRSAIHDEARDRTEPLWKFLTRWETSNEPRRRSTNAQGEARGPSGEGSGANQQVHRRGRDETIKPKSRKGSDIAAASRAGRSNAEAAKLQSPSSGGERPTSAFDQTGGT